MTEFGRRVQENGNAGLDHGHGGLMLLLGGGLVGGQVHGKWPGLAAGRAGQRRPGRPQRLPRRARRDPAARRSASATVKKVFPDHPYTRLGVLQVASARRDPPGSRMARPCAQHNRGLTCLLHGADSVAAHG